MNLFGTNIGTKPDRLRIYYQSDSSDKNISTELGIEFYHPSQLSTSYSTDISVHEVGKETNLQFKETSRDDFSITVYVDTSSEENTAYDNVNTKLDELRSLVGPTIHGADNKKPPMCRIASGSLDFKGYITRLTEEYVFFNAAGFPVRAKVGLTLKSVSSPEVADKNNASGNSRKAWVIKSGDRLDLIANRFYGDTALWKYIAEENGIENPLLFPLPEQLGQPLIIPDKILLKI